MIRMERGFWKTCIEVPPGRYEYTFSVDDQWADNLPGSAQVDNVCVQDVSAAKRVRDEFGSHSCLLFI
jgi:hypothetical protein